MAPVPEENTEKPRDKGDSMDSLQGPDVIINTGSSDSEGEGDNEDDYPQGFMGYEPLPQDIDDAQASSEDDEGEEQETIEETPVSQVAEGGHEVTEDTDPEESHDDIPAFLPTKDQKDFPSSIDNVPNYMKVPDLPRPDKKELLWNQPRPVVSQQAMDKGEADQIRNVMSAFKLPAANIPDWAKSLSDEQWKQDVVSRLLPVDSQRKPGKNSTSARMNEASTSSDSSAPAGGGVTTLNCDQSESVNTKTEKHLKENN